MAASHPPWIAADKHHDSLTSIKHPHRATSLEPEAVWWGGRDGGCSSPSDSKTKLMREAGARLTCDGDFNATKYQESTEQ